MSNLINTFQWRGKSVQKPEREKAPVCACGNKYLKTRKNQRECLLCIFRKQTGARQKE